MGDSEWCESCDAFPCECKCSQCGRETDYGSCSRCNECVDGNVSSQWDEKSDEESEDKKPLGERYFDAFKVAFGPQSAEQYETPDSLLNMYKSFGPRPPGQSDHRVRPPMIPPYLREKEINESLNQAAAELDRELSIPEAIAAECDEIRDLLQAKNKSYGNSAFEPVGIFAGGDALELIATRADDKLSRIKNMGGLAECLNDYSGEDAIQDLIGYLILARIAVKRDS